MKEQGGTRWLQAADNTSKRNSRGITRGLSNVEVIGCPARGQGWQSSWRVCGVGGGSGKNRRRGIVKVRECIRLFREDLQCKRVEIRPGEPEDWRGFYFYFCFIYIYIILGRQETRERNTDRLPPIHTPTGNGTGAPLVHWMMLNQLNHIIQGTWRGF